MEPVVRSVDSCSCKLKKKKKNNQDSKFWMFYLQKQWLAYKAWLSEGLWIDFDHLGTLNKNGP